MPIACCQDDSSDAHCDHFGVGLYFGALGVQWAARFNLLCVAVSSVSLAFTLLTQRLHWRDVWSLVDDTVALPTLSALIYYSADPPSKLARWCWVLLAAYALGVLLDLVWLYMGRWRAAPSRATTALADAGSLWMWTQAVYYNRQLERSLREQARPIAIITVSGNRVEARLP
ncbi:hypothetical protein EMIHUDRAFT_248238 [Emiliania huxleyi CCMP1516]|uniref:Uncharacterized protein n=2 Tax=Emiliania huxleyi TaxID=2903 RepID=A0A0D3IHQ0_EMIH1|nr:hypothetical protein EMIHUDRAFT_248238 [Emiliania huxleyi CCMP1516]EOD10785.1 hypothetical protein EMIHUDRAFT_248238 [Emiliania huxleyi CCMP1516]|eukprot:XP_005763214.1 hypothetical protein EMIHUDRAFT_248238 [Emiliania huxleyi CCMP1516]